MHNHNETFDALPIGLDCRIGGPPVGSPQTPFLWRLYPFLEQDALHRTLSPCYETTSWTSFTGPAVQAAEAPIPGIRCPSDGRGGVTFQTTDSNVIYLPRINYLMVFTGSNMADAVADAAGSAPGRTMFGINVARRLSDVTDGLSNSLALVEYLTGTPPDARGTVMGAWPGGSHVYAAVTPNSSVPDVLVGYNGSDRWCPAAGNLPSQNLPCVKGPAPWDQSWPPLTAAARSRHPGGVNVLLGDGSVRFVRDSIQLATWRALASIAGGEVVGDY